MSRNGSGTYNLPAGNPVVTGTTITSTWANTTLNDIASALTGSVASDGQTPMSSSLNMATNKIINVSDPANPQDAATKSYVDASIPSTSNFLTKTNNLSDVTSASTSRTNLGLGSIATQNSNSVSITGGSISGITSLAVADGGTGSSTLTANNVLLGNGTSALQTVAPSTSGNVLTSNGTTWVSSAPTTGLGVGQTWTSFTSGTRGSGTTYTNSTGKPIVVAVGAAGTSSGVTIAVNGVTVANQVNGSATSMNNSANAIVPNGATYSCTYSPTFLFWSELR